MQYDISLRHNKADYLFSIVAMLQPFLLLLQLFLIDALHLPEESASLFRVASTVLPVILALGIICIRNFKTVLVVYGVILIVLLITNTIYVDRWPVMANDVIKFLLPVVIPTGLCVYSVRNLAVFLKCCTYSACACAIVAILYVAYYFMGFVFIEGYSISFSYALLFPVAILATNKSIWLKSIAIFLLVAIFAIGSRGALVTAIVYLVFLYFWGRKSLGSMVISMGLGYIAFLLMYQPVLSFLADMFNAFGIKSRTLILLMENEVVSHDSGRDVIHDLAWRLIDKSPLFGNGVWADRAYLDVYCHNVFIELLLDFGYIGAAVILISLSTYLIKRFKPLNMYMKLVFLLFLICTFVPLFVSKSYLTDPNVSLMIGLAALLYKNAKANTYQDTTLDLFTK